MKCTNKHRKYRVLLSVTMAALVLSACGADASFAFPYTQTQERKALSSSDVAVPFSQSLCVAGADTGDDAGLFSGEESAALFDLRRRETLCAYRVHERMDPASMTKVMTALIAVENGSLDDRLTCYDADYITERGAQLLDMEQGESMTLHQALNFLLVFSANDVAVMIAENLCGDVDRFVKLMNEKALSLGATNTHFTNPHGLTDPDQYVTAYDMYLIFNAAMQYDVIRQIIGQSSYKTQYYRADGELKEAEVSTTNAYLRENSSVSAPAGVTVIGGKTGSTYAAGECLVLYVTDVNADPYIAVYMHAPDTATLYRKMSLLLGKIVDG